jgi:hypothetical protein
MKTDTAEHTPDGWYSYGDTGYETHATAAEARQNAQDMLELYREDADGEWPDGVEHVEWGRIVPFGWTVEVPDPDREDVSDYQLREDALDTATGPTFELQDGRSNRERGPLWELAGAADWTAADLRRLQQLAPGERFELECGGVFVTSLEE